MTTFALITGAFIGLWCGFLWGYAVCYREWMRSTATMSDPRPIVQNFTRSSTTSRGHR